MVNTENLIIQNRYLTEQVERQTQEVKRHMDRISAINIVAATVSQSLDLDKTLATALDVVTGVIGAEAGGISMIDEETNEVVLKAQLGWEQDFVTQPMRVPAGKGMSGQVIEGDDLLVINDLKDEPIDIAVPRFKNESFRSLAMAPMHARGKIVGILSIMSSRPDRFNDPILEMLRAIADTVGVALDNARLHKVTVENESRLSAILQSTADGIIATDARGVIRMMNASAERMLGINHDTAIELPLRDAPISPNLREPLRVALSSREESPEKSFQVKMPDERVLLVFVSPVCDTSLTVGDADDERDNWVIVLQDVTHLRRAEELKAQFIQAAAHDMRNPLGVTMTSLGTLQTVVTDPLSQEIIDVALSGVNRLQQMIDDLLNLERIENGYIFKIDDIDITEIIYEVVAQCRPLADKKGQTCEVEIQSVLGMIPADAHWISRALINYVGNATKYTPNGGQIRIRAFIKEGFVHIEVADNGRGIPLDVHSRLFERFYRVKEASSERGSGLGLAIVKSVVEAHGGGVYMRSRVGEGSTFGMTLPQEQLT